MNKANTVYLKTQLSSGLPFPPPHALCLVRWIEMTSLRRNACRLDALRAVSCFTLSNTDEILTSVRKVKDCSRAKQPRLKTQTCWFIICRRMLSFHLSELTLAHFYPSCNDKEKLIHACKFRPCQYCQRVLLLCRAVTWESLLIGSFSGLEFMNRAQDKANAGQGDLYT